MASYIYSMRTDGLTFVAFDLRSGRGEWQAHLNEIRRYLRKPAFKGRYTYGDHHELGAEDVSCDDRPRGFYFTDPDTAMHFRLRFG